MHLASCILFLLALLPRLFSLGRFMTADEPAWIRRSAAFLQALQQGDFAATFINRTPGVTTLWTGGLGLLLAHAGRGELDAFLQRVIEHPADAALLPAVRLPTALIAALCVVATWVLVRELFGDRVAVVSAILLALDPLYLAHSRILHHDALVTSFMTVSALSAMVYWLERPSPGWLALSGLAAGLAFLTKANAGFLVLFAGLLVVVAWLGGERRGAGRLAGSLVLWGAMAGAVAVALWPALWADPVGTVAGVVGNVARVASSFHRKGGFSWGRVQPDPGPLFYPAVLLWKASPLTLIGLALGVGWWLRGDGRSRRHGLWLVAYAVGYGALISLSSKKGDRYLLPSFPMMDIVAALGLVWLGGVVARRWNWPRPVTGVALVLLLQAATVLPYHPYYLANYNPLLLGWWVAPRWFQVGWGEGLDVAARYLNGREDVTELTVAVWFPDQFSAFFRGRAEPLLSVEQALTADYAVFYVSQVQRQLPAPEVVAYFAQRQPEYVVRLGGMDHAWVYRGPVVGTGEPQPRFPLGGRFADRVELLGYDLETGNWKLETGIHVTLYWRCLSPMSEDYNVYLRLVDGAGHRWGQRDRYPVMGLWGTSRWRPGQVVMDEYRLPVRPGTPPGDYRLEVGLYSLADGRVLPVAEGDPTGFGGGLLLGTVHVARAARPPAPDDLGMERAVGRALGPEIELLGYDFDGGTARPGDRRPLTLYWRAKRKPAADYTPLAQLADAAGTVRRQWPLPLPYPTGRWARGEVVVQQAELTVPANVPSGQYELRLALSDPGGALLGPEVALGALRVESRQRTFDVPPIPHPLSANFDDKVRLLGYATRITHHASRLTLYWQALSEMDTSYTVFVHVLDSGGRIVAQRDSVPGGGALPTTGWVAGEVIADEVELRLESGTPPGEYTVEVGLYDAATGQRLPVVGDGDAVTLGVVELGAVP